MIYFSNYGHAETAITTISNTANLNADKFIGSESIATFDATNIKLSLSNTANKSEYYNGEEIIYTIIINNAADSDENATNIYVKDILPAQIKDVTATSSIETPTVTGNNTTGYTVSFHLDNLNKNETLILTIKGTLNLN